jgi:acylphosphatase
MASGDQARLSAVACGTVQMVGYRDFVRRKAVALGLRGWVRNLPSGDEVMVEAEGPRLALEALLQQLRTGPMLASVQDVRVQWREPTGEFLSFNVH